MTISTRIDDLVSAR